MALQVFSVDDSKTIKAHLEYLFHGIPDVNWTGHAFDIEEAKARIHNEKPDVVLLDIMVGEESGLDLLEHIQTHYPATEVFMLSNLNDAIYAQKSKQLGALHFIDKSYDFEKIPVLLNQLNAQKEELGAKLTKK